jgi:PadR family transcriptional regulator AphA
MSLDYTLLGFLNNGPMTGYELKKALDESTQFFWHAELSQIYPALKQLEKDGLVTGETQPQDGKPDKKIYSITSTGRERLLAWLSEPMDELPAIKNQVLLKLFFAGALPKAEIIRQMRYQLLAQQAQLKRVQQETSAKVHTLAAEDGLAQPAVMWELVRQYGEALAQTNTRWLEMAIKTLELQPAIEGDHDDPTHG